MTYRDYAGQGGGLDTPFFTDMTTTVSGRARPWLGSARKESTYQR